MFISSLIEKHMNKQYSSLGKAAFYKHTYIPHIVSFKFILTNSYIIIHFISDSFVFPLSPPALNSYFLSPTKCKHPNVKLTTVDNFALQNILPLKDFWRLQGLWNKLTKYIMVKQDQLSCQLP